MTGCAGQLFGECDINALWRLNADDHLTTIFAAPHPLIYKLYGLNDMDPNKIPQWEVDNFKRATHTGVLSFYMYDLHGSGPMSAPATLSYTCTKE